MSNEDDDLQRRVDEYKARHPDADPAEIKEYLKRREADRAKTTEDHRRRRLELGVGGDLTAIEAAGRRGTEIAAQREAAGELPLELPETLPPPTSTPPEPAKSTAADRKGKPKRRTKKRNPEPDPPKVDATALRAELDRLSWGAEECAVLARIEWARLHDGAECPANRIPTPKDLDEWRCPKDADHIRRGEITAILRDIARVLGDSGEPFPGIRLSVTSDGRFGIGDRPAKIEQGGQDSDFMKDALQRMRTFGGGAAAAAVLTEEGNDVPLWILSMYWHHCPPERRPRHTCGPLMAAWLEHGPVTTEAATRADRRILPALRVVGPSPERERGVLFGGLVDDRPRTADLTLFPDLEPTRHRVPLLEIVDRTGAPLRSRGRGAPIEARLIVRGGLLMIRPEDRRLTIVRIAVTVRELLDGLWPPRRDKRGWVDRDVRHNWPKLIDALYRVHNYTVTSATGGRWFPMTLRELPALGPDGRPALDDAVTLDLAPPPGAVHGSSVDLPWLDHMGVTSGPKWRAYIAGRSLIWTPGTTRRPVPKTDRQRYGWSRNPEDYPVLTLDDLRRLAFGDRDAKNRTRAAILAPWLNLPDLNLVEATDQRTGVRGWRLLPTDRSDG